MKCDGDDLTYATLTDNNDIDSDDSCATIAIFIA